MVDWYQVRAAPIEAVQHGVDAADAHFELTYTGPRTYDRIDYPAAEVLPESTERQDGTNWRHRVITNLYFERDRDLDYLEDVLHPTAAVLDETLSALSDVECVTDYHPSSIQDFAGELDNTSVLLVMIRFEALSQIDPAEF